MTTAQDLMNRVRSNIFEITGGEALRTDNEIYIWLNDSLYDYVAKIPSDAFPELVTETAVTFPWNIPDDFEKLIEVVVTHTVGGASVTELAYVLTGDQSYLRLMHTDGRLGAWAQIRGVGGDVAIDAGPTPTAGVVKYIHVPQNLKTPTQNLGLDAEHEEPLVNRATALALSKINDEDSAFYMALYNERVAAEQKKYLPEGGLVR